jgi:Kae1-associated kinase Bud32
VITFLAKEYINPESILNSMELIAAGAEASIYQTDGKVVKERKPKAYRIKELDEKLRLSRTKREAKVMEALKKQGLNVPKVLAVDENACSVTMELVDGKKVRDILTAENNGSICREIGTMIGLMHKNDIVHGDLTTSNMILDGTKVYFIDFGLSMFSKREEDKAVDLHLFRQALESSHHQITAECFTTAMTAYKKANPSWKSVFERLEIVEERGRNKHKE